MPANRTPPSPQTRYTLFPPHHITHRTACHGNCLTPPRHTTSTSNSVTLPSSSSSIYSEPGCPNCDMMWPTSSNRSRSSTPCRTPTMHTRPGTPTPTLTRSAPLSIHGGDAEGRGTSGSIWDTHLFWRCEVDRGLGWGFIVPVWRRAGSVSGRVSLSVSERKVEDEGRKERTEKERTDSVVEEGWELRRCEARREVFLGCMTREQARGAERQKRRRSWKVKGKWVLCGGKSL